MVSDEEMKKCEREIRRLLDIKPCEGGFSGLYDEEGYEDEPDFYGILRECAWNILHENPGTEFGDWATMLTEQYPAEVVDALGSSPFDVFPALSDMWDCDDYEDPDTGMCHNFAEWAGYFATDRSVELYDELADARREIKRLTAFLGSKQKPSPKVANAIRGPFLWLLGCVLTAAQLLVCNFRKILLFLSVCDQRWLSLGSSPPPLIKLPN